VAHFPRLISHVNERSPLPQPIAVVTSPLHSLTREVGFERYGLFSTVEREHNMK
jgi:hypothetical protein